MSRSAFSQKLGHNGDMKDILKKAKKALGEVIPNQTSVSKSNDVQEFLTQVAAMPKRDVDAHMIFALDATASREETWDIARQLQTEMFLSARSLGGLNLQLCYFRGFAEFFTSQWENNADQIVQVMAGMHCEAGATQIEKVLSHAINESQIRKIKCLVYIGDAMEENVDILANLAGKLGLLNIPLFMFQERGDPATRKAFMECARLSGGAYSQFDHASVSHLRDLLKAVAVYAAGGYKALKNFTKSSTKEVKLLERQLKS